MSSNTLVQDTTLARAAEATTRLKIEIDQMWSDSVTANDGVVAERLAAVSNAIRRVSHLLHETSVIG